MPVLRWDDFLKQQIPAFALHPESFKAGDMEFHLSVISETRSSESERWPNTSDLCVRGLGQQFDRCGMA